jgi:hypothetical protein
MIAEPWAHTKLHLVPPDIIYRTAGVCIRDGKYLSFLLSPSFGVYIRDGIYISFLLSADFRNLY